MDFRHFSPEDADTLAIAINLIEYPRGDVKDLVGTISVDVFRIRHKARSHVSFCLKGLTNVQLNEIQSLVHIDINSGAKS
jgi:hypothetical protein